MAALSADKSIIQAAFIDECREIGGDEANALKFAKALRRAALIGTSTAVDDVFSHLQDYTAAGVSSESSNTQWMRSMDAALIAEFSHVAVQQFEAEIAAGGKDKMPKLGSSTYGSFH
jgi:hypothetical protein